MGVISLAGKEGGTERGGGKQACDNQRERKKGPP